MTEFTQEEFNELADELRTTARALLPEIVERKLPLMLVALEHMVVPQITVEHFWSPIDNAPRDGSFVLGKRGRLWAVVSWRKWRLGDDVLADNDYRWRDLSGGRHFSPDKWMTIPEDHDG